ncbi:four helix bundle protein [Pelagicoccus sp. NFK12]|uniref:Four helix bundle protein n=1 Tax=Pelagicoccus enzymogenes TaxID=2773457 RepID=A0A927FC97_9BACT|nr:four helix bundle protein [Pelagicoccus enzymogenes]MBD5781070.1 four helix bundle protein [Pelagicoccus enzymogenes]
MAHYETFEDLPIWQLARKLAASIYSKTRTGEFARDRGLKDQIQRASVSIVSNIAEGFERKSDKEFINFLSIAKGSAGEVRAQLYIALDINYITEPEQTELNESLKDLSAQIAGLMRYLQNKQQR